MIKDGKEYFDGFIKQKHRCKYYKSKDDSLCLTGSVTGEL
ncbi:hypothetical protein HNR52_002434 [Thermoanaerobacterium thermosulfurigenes]